MLGEEKQVTIVEYQLLISKTGAGATQAVTDFKAVEAAATKTKAALAEQTTAMAKVTTTTKTAASAMKGLQGAITLVGMQAFPQLTTATTATIHTMKGLADVAKVSGLGLSGMGAALAVVATVAYTAKVAMESFKASAQWDASNSALAGQMDAFATGVGNKRDSLRDRIKGLQKTDSITPEWAGVLNKEIDQGGRMRKCATIWSG